MKDLFLELINKYLYLFSEEKEKYKEFTEYLNNNNDITDWNNFNGHVVVGGFIYAKKEKKFLVIYHNDLKMYLYPGGHIDNTDSNPLEAVKREIKEETGITNINEIVLSDNKLVPIDINIHMIPYNERLDLKEHYHYEFRYLFTIDSIQEVTLDTTESSSFKWIDINELKDDKNFGEIVKKFEGIIAYESNYNKR